MAGVIQDHIKNARDLLEAAQAEYQRAQQERGGAAVTALRNACGKGWLAALEAANAFFIKQGTAEEDLPNTDRGRRYFAARYMDRSMRKAFDSLRSTFHIDGYYEGILEFEDMPEYFDELREFIDQAEQAPAQS
jgi:hypothetical protein